MNITNIINRLPESARADIIDFSDVLLKTGKKALRVTFDRILTDAEKQKMTSKKIIGKDLTCYYRHAPEIIKSYCYIAY